MRNLLIAIVCATIVTRSIANESSKSARNLESTKAPITVFDYQNWYEEACELEERVGQRDRHSERPSGCTEQRPGINFYNELIQVGAVYNRLTIRQPDSQGRGTTTKKFEDPKEEMGAKPPQIRVFDSKQHTVVPEPIHKEWTSPPKKHNCKCESECTCPPYVCDTGSCKANYVVIFGRKDCSHCRKMWKVIPRMRKKGYIVFYVDTKAFPHVFKQFKMKVVPTTLVYDKEHIIARFNGITTQEKIAEFLKSPKKDNK